MYSPIPVDRLPVVFFHQASDFSPGLLVEICLIHRLDTVQRAIGVGVAVLSRSGSSGGGGRRSRGRRGIGVPVRVARLGVVAVLDRADAGVAALGDLVGVDICVSA